MLTLALIILAVLSLSALFSGSETAFLSIGPADVEEMVHQKKFGVNFLKKLSKQMSHAIIAIAILNNAVNIAGSILVGQTVVKLYGDGYLAITSAVLTFAVILFSEIIPKSIGVHYANHIAPKIAPLFLAIVYLLFPLIFILEYITSLFIKGEKKIGTESQIKSLVRLGWRRGHIEPDEGLLINRVFLLNDKRAEDIMVSRDQIVGLKHNITIDEAAKIAMDQGFARLPVYKKNLNNIIGMVLKSDLVEAIARDQYTRLLSSFLRPIPSVLAEMKADDLLLMFQKERTHIAIVKDHGKTVGLVTLEEVLEELVGDIIDEGDITIHKK